MSEKVLMPCPFCGSKAEIIKRYSADYHTDVFYVKCVICGSMNDDYFTEAEAIEAWNKRAEPERKKGEWVVTSEFEDCRYVKCNQCKVTQVFYYNKPLTNFCSNCGAEMMNRGK